MRVDGEPIMVLGDDQKLDDALAVRGLVLRRLGNDEGDVHVSVAVEGGVVGTRWAWLSASATGVGVYRRIGFAAVEQLDHWVLRAT